MNGSLSQDECQAYTDHWLKVAEQFYSIQGEGKNAGVPSLFLRLTSCNLLCPGYGTTGCDTTEVWKQGLRKSFEEIYSLWMAELWWEKLVDYPRAHLVVTGGEPLLQQERMWKFVRWLSRKEMGHRLYVEVETNGTIKPRFPFTDRFQMSIQYNCSPKLTSAGNEYDKAHVPEVLEYFSGLSWHETTLVTSGCFFKFVVQDDEDIVEVRDMVEKYGINPDHVYLMPEGTSQEDLHSHYAWVADVCKRTRYKFSPRLQVSTWGRVTGV